MGLYSYHHEDRGQHSTGGIDLFNECLISFVRKEWLLLLVGSNGPGSESISGNPKEMHFGRGRIYYSGQLRCRARVCQQCRSCGFIAFKARGITKTVAKVSVTKMLNASGAFSTSN